MSDVGGPNDRIEKKKIEVQIGQLEQNKRAIELRIMQLDAERDTSLANMSAIDAGIADLQAKLNAPPPQPQE